jgi:hypothetical protein
LIAIAAVVSPVFGGNAMHNDLTPLTDLVVCAGDDATFTTTASGAGPFKFQWYKNGSALSGKTNSTLTLTDVSAADIGTYTVKLIGGHNVATDKAALSLRNPVRMTPLVSQTNCPGSMVEFDTEVSGVGSYALQWFKDGSPLDGETGPSLVLTNVSDASQGVYSVVLNGPCHSVTNSATLSLYDSTAVSALAILVRNIGDSATFSVAASGSGPFTYVWKKDNVVITGQTNSSLTLSNISLADDGTYTVEVTGMCNTAEQNAALHVNIPPAIDIFSPTNDASFLAPANFTLAVNAQDFDGSVTNVEFFETTNKLGETGIGNPFILVLTGVALGTHTYTARATDNNGATSVSSALTVHVVDSLPASDVQVPTPILFAERMRVSSADNTAVNRNAANEKTPHGKGGRHAFGTADWNFAVRFMSVSNRIYRMQCSGDLKNWETVPTPIAGNGNWIHWIDNGESTTESGSPTTDARFYRVITLP